MTHTFHVELGEECGKGKMDTAGWRDPNKVSLKQKESVWRTRLIYDCKRHKLLFRCWQSLWKEIHLSSARPTHPQKTGHEILGYLKKIVTCPTHMKISNKAQ